LRPRLWLYFCQQGQDLVILLAGGDKSTQSADIANAIALKNEL
jgi:putative addiction module killer protein